MGLDLDSLDSRDGDVLIIANLSFPLRTQST